MYKSYLDSYQFCSVLSPYFIKGCIISGLMGHELFDDKCEEFPQ